MNYVIYSIKDKVVRHKTHSRATALYTLEIYNKQRGELSFAMMDKATYERNYGNEQMVLREKR